MSDHDRPEGFEPEEWHAFLRVMDETLRLPGETPVALLDRIAALAAGYGESELQWLFEPIEALVDGHWDEVGERLQDLLATNRRLRQATSLCGFRNEAVDALVAGLIPPDDSLDT